MDECIKCTVSGWVQGVLYRQTVKKGADELGLVGWVRNNPDRTVSVVAEGDKESLKGFVAMLEEGSSWSRVTDVSVEWCSATGDFQDFSIVSK